MSAILAFCVHHVRNYFKWIFPNSRNNLLIDRTPYGLPVPKTIHKVVSEEELGGRTLMIIGDVHGCYDELVELMDICNARDPNVCPIFVGDLVRKGPHSDKVVKLVRQLNCYCVRGNHDEVALLAWQRHVEKEEDMEKKNQWLHRLSREDIQWLSALPFSVSVPSHNIIITHAGLVPGIDLASQSLNDMLHLRDITFDAKTLTFSGHTKYHPNGQPWAQAWEGPEHIYFGHDAKRFYQSYPYATGIDLGCVYGGHLAAVFPDDDNKVVKVQARNRKPYEKRIESAPAKLQ